MRFRFGEFELDEERRQLLRAGRRIVLQPLVFDLLALLVRNHRRVVSKDELLDTLWGAAGVTEGSLQRAISVARSLLDDASHDLIQTFPRYGYRFGADVAEEGGRALPQGGTDAVDLPAPHIRYARAADGVRIAYWTLGRGPALVYVPNLIWSHSQMEWQFPEIRRWYRGLARGRRLIRIDPRGTGSSTREVADYSIAEIQKDVDAVVDRLELDAFSLFGDLNGGSVALRYAARRPERVSRLILWHAFARTRDIETPRLDMLESLQALMDRDWEAYTETRAHMGFGWEDGGSAHRYAALMRECVSPEMALRSYEAGRRDDVTSLLPRIAAPTLVLHRRRFYFWDVQVSRDLAARIADSRLVVLDGAGSAPFLGDAEGLLGAIDAFLGSS